MALRWYDPTLGKGLFEGDQESKAKRVFDAILQEFEDLQRKASSAQGILLSLPAARSGLAGDILVSLQEYLEPLLNPDEFGLLPSGAVIGFDGTLAEAKALRGWHICDGEGGTSDLMGRYPKWAADGADSGDTGGALTHSHSDHTEQDVIDAIADHAFHNHAYSGTTGDAAGCGCCVRNDSADEEVAVVGHTHSFSGTTSNNTAGENHVPNAHAPLEHSSSNHEPPYTTLIPIMKL